VGYVGRLERCVIGDVGESGWEGRGETGGLELAGRGSWRGRGVDAVSVGEGRGLGTPVLLDVAAQAEPHPRRVVETCTIVLMDKQDAFVFPLIYCRRLLGYSVSDFSARGIGCVSRYPWSPMSFPSRLMLYTQKREQMDSYRSESILDEHIRWTAYLTNIQIRREEIELCSRKRWEASCAVTVPMLSRKATQRQGTNLLYIHILM
jgi:hypothetical protein